MNNTKGWTTIEPGKKYRNGVIMMPADDKLQKQSGGDRWIVFYAMETKARTFPTKVDAQMFAAARKNEGAEGVIKVGRNQIFRDKAGWVVEMFEFEQNGTPMFSVFDVFPTKKQAMNIARAIKPGNQNRIRNLLMKDRGYMS